MPERLYSTYQVADLLGTTPATVVDWMQKGFGSGKGEGALTKLFGGGGGGAGFLSPQQTAQYGSSANVGPK